MPACLSICSYTSKMLQISLMYLFLLFCKLWGQLKVSAYLVADEMWASVIGLCDILPLFSLNFLSIREVALKRIFPDIFPWGLQFSILRVRLVFKYYLSEMITTLQLGRYCMLCGYLNTHVMWVLSTWHMMCEKSPQFVWRGHTILHEGNLKWRGIPLLLV